MKLTHSFLIAISVVTTTTIAGAQSECSSVYANATRNIAFSQRQSAELSYYFNKHCQKNGEVNNSSLGVGIDAIVEGIPFSFSGNSNNSSEKLEEFCKAGVQQNYSQNTSTDFRNEVVVAALSSFNQCLALQNRGLRLTHLEQPPRSVLIYGELTNTTTKASLDAISFDAKRVSCRSTSFNSDGKAIQVDGSKSLPIKKNFTIECVRNATVDAGNSFYPRSVIGVSTSLGPYSIELVEDQLYGFATANQAKINHDKVLRERDVALQQKSAAEGNAAALQQRLNSPAVELRTLSMGEYDPPTTQYFKPRFYCGTNIQAEAAKMCGGRRTFVRNVGAHGGNKCGYNHYVVACLSQ